VSAVPLVRAAWGLFLVTQPSTGVRVVVGRPATGTVRQVARVLGIRQMLQAAVTGVHDDRTMRRIGASADALHALSMVALAVASRRWRRTGVVETAIAALFALATVRPRRRVVRPRSIAGSSALRYQGHR
jgi:hypothetical protein